MLEPIQVWWAPVGTGEAAGVALMHEEERRRYAQMHRPAQARFALSCALLRAAAAQLMGCPPHAVPLRRVCPDCDRAHGKPTLPAWTGLELSLSHTDSWAVCAVSRTGRVGVDIENALPQGVNHDSLADRILSPRESTAYKSLTPGDDRSAWFLTYWVRKEAFLKATGHGLRHSMASITVSRPDEHPRLLTDPAQEGVPPTTLHNLRGPEKPTGRPMPVAQVLAHIAASSSSEDITVVEADADEILAPLIRRYSGNIPDR